MEKQYFGIDLGTTTSAIAVYEDGDTRILKNSDGNEITPSVVFFGDVEPGEDDDISVGIQAKNMAATNPDNVVQFIKRKMGYSDDKYKIPSPGGKLYTPEMISALILQKVCKDAESFVETPIKDVVITVPADFNDAQRTATKQAGKIAGLNVVNVLNEPTAAAIAFGLEHTQNGKVLVYDLGGGTCDVTIMEINNGEFDVIATCGDPKLGGIPQPSGEQCSLLLCRLHGIPVQQ